MARKTALWILAVICVAVSPIAAGQQSPLQWPVPAPSPREQAIPHLLVGVHETARLLVRGSAVPFDVRGVDAYEKGHLPGAVAAWSPDEEASGGIEPVRSLLAGRGITGEEAVVLYGNPDREAVARLFWLLRQAGCSEVRILDGGLAAWRAAGHPLESGASRRPPAPKLRLPSPEPVAVDSRWVADAFGQAGIELLDVRDARGWDHWQTPPTFAAGHIPYSLPFDPRSLLPAGDGWPDPHGLRRRLGTLGPRPGDPVRLESTFVLYGEDGRDPRLGLGYLLLTLAGLEARVFSGGWSEWTAGGGRPMVRVISAAELASLLRREDPALDQDRPQRGVILIDLRETRDFAIGHLPGALSLPYYFFPESFEKKVEEGWPGLERATVPLVFYCYGIDCVRSRKAGARAARLGFRDVVWFRGGVQEWRDAGLPLPPATAPRERASPAPGTARRSP
jgi:thiosulfate/3-mercaptopyruvate sulfurtransferase